MKLTKTFLRVCLHPLKLKSKAQANNLAGRIVNEITQYEQDIDIRVFNSSIGSGQTWCGGIFDGDSKKAIAWRGQQVFAIDVDNKDGSVELQELVNHYHELGFTPNITYYSLSSTIEKPKFRLIWVVDEIITDPDKALGFKRWLIKNSLGAADPACINLDRLYFGGKNSFIHNRVPIPSEVLPYESKKIDTIEKKEISDELLDVELWRNSKKFVQRCMKDPHNTKWGSRHQTIFKGSVFLVWASNGSKTPEDIYEFLHSCMVEYDTVWNDYDRDSETIRSWITRAYRWSLSNIF